MNVAKALLLTKIIKSLSSLDPQKENFHLTMVLNNLPLVLDIVSQTMCVSLLERPAYTALQQPTKLSNSSLLTLANWATYICSEKSRELYHIIKWNCQNHIVMLQ